MTKPRTPTDEEKREVSRMLAEHHNTPDDSPYIDDPTRPSADPDEGSVTWQLRQFRQKT